MVQAANGTNSDSDLESIQDEIDQRVNEIDRVSDQTDFNGTAVLGGTDGGAGGNNVSVGIQVGANDGESIEISVDNVQAKKLGDTGDSEFGGSGATLEAIDVTAGGASDLENGDILGSIDLALQQIDSTRSNLGAIQNRFESAITNLETNQTNLTDARSRIEDADFAEEVSNQVKSQILQQAGTSVLAQANQTPQNVLSLLG